MTSLFKLTEEYLQARRGEETLTAEDFANRYPDLPSEERDELLEVLSAAELMETMKTAVPGASAAPTPVIPHNLGEFQLLEELGRGGMGTVYKAIQNSLHRTVALKILSPIWANNPEQRERFENESRTIARLHHTHIVEVYGAGEENGFLYYVMEWIDGQGLNRVSLDTAFPGASRTQVAAQLGLQAAEALAFAHSNGILHRDVKPSNLLLDSQGSVHVSDFGIATSLQEESGFAATRSQDGTLRYMAPERLLRGENGTAADQYSLGLTLYELVTGAAPIHETSPGKLIRKICDEKLPPLKTEDLNFNAIINKCTSYEPTERYESMEALAADLRRYLAKEPIQARPATLARRLNLWARRRPTVAALSGVALLLGISLLVSIGIGLAQTKHSLRETEAALELARENAQIADETLRKVFGVTLSSQGIVWSDVDGGASTVSGADARLLKDLMPYYERMSAARQAPAESIADAYRTLGMLALQTDDPALAESSFHEAAARYASGSWNRVFCDTHHALALSRQGKFDLAVQQWLEIARNNAENPDFECRLEAVRAFRNASRVHAGRHHGFGKSRVTRRENKPESKPESKPENRRENRHPSFWEVEANRELGKRMMVLLQSLVREQPAHPDCRLLLAQILSDSRQLREFRGKPDNAPKLAIPVADIELSGDPSTLLEQLVTEYPERYEYQLEFVRCMSRLSLEGEEREKNQERLRTALLVSERLLAAFPEDTEILQSYIGLRGRFIRDQFQQKRFRAAGREIQRSTGVLRFLTLQPDASNACRESLLDLLLAQIFPRRPDNDEEITEILAEIDELLETYTGPRKTEFQNRLTRLRERTPKSEISTQPLNQPSVK